MDATVVGGHANRAVKERPMSRATVRTGASRLCTLAVVAAVLLFAEEAWANVASPLMFKRIYYLLWANVLIAAVETIVVCAMFKTRPWMTFLLLLAANYISAWAGYAFFGSMDGAGMVYAFFEDPVLQMRQIFWICVVLSLLASIALEWPCFTAALPQERRSWRRGFRAALVGQLVS